MSQPEPIKAAGNYPAAVVWDLDGTLVESAPDLAAALNSVLGARGLPAHSVAAVRLMIGAGVPKLIERGFRAANARLSQAELEDIVPEFMEIYSACATRNTYLIDHARETLELMKQAGVTQGLCTNKPIAVTRKILAALDIDQYFGSVVGGDSTSGRKPDPLPLQTCIDNLSAAPSETVMVGDSGADVGAARAAGVPVIIVPDGYTGVPPDELGADGIATSHRADQSLLRDMQGNSA